MADWVRDKALMQITSSLGADALIPTYLVADEQISHPFGFEIMAVSHNGVIDPNSILNLPILGDTDGQVPRTAGRRRAGHSTRPAWGGQVKPVDRRESTARQVPSGE
jgi:uncharacterized protein involved in type VI secretion and phage assembly